jgi:hypothetical protein
VITIKKYQRLGISDKQKSNVEAWTLAKAVPLRVTKRGR